MTGDSGDPYQMERFVAAQDRGGGDQCRRAHATDGSGRGYGHRVDFELTPEQVQFRNVVREFAEAEIAPHAADWDRDHCFPVETVLNFLNLLAEPHADGPANLGLELADQVGGRLLVAVPNPPNQRAEFVIRRRRRRLAARHDPPNPRARVIESAG